MAEVGGAVAAIGIVVAVAAAGVGTYVAVKQAQDAEKQAKAVGKEKEQEAAIAAENAAFEAKQHRRRVALLLGQQQAAFAGAGFETSSGTPLVQELDVVQQGELEALTIQRGGQLTARSRIFEANMAKFVGDTARESIPYTIAGGVLGAAGSGISAYRSTTTSFSSTRSSSPYGRNYNG